MIFLLKLLASFCALATVVWWIHRGYRAKRTYRRLAMNAAKVFERDRDRLEETFNAMHQEIFLRQQAKGLSNALPTGIKLLPQYPLLASDAYAGEIYALAPAIASFQTANDSVVATSSTATFNASEEKEKEPTATAIYRWSEGKRGHWLPTERLLLNITPDAALKQFGRSLTKIEAT